MNHPTKSAINNYVMYDKISREKQRENSDLTCLTSNLCVTASHEVVFVTQEKPLGLGHAVLCAREHVLPGPVAVILPDDLILSSPGCLNQMMDIYAKCVAGHLVGTIAVQQDHTDRYGILSIRSHDGPLCYADSVVEKPPCGQAPSQTAVVGRYILDPSIFDDLETQGPGSGGEIQLTDAIARGITRVGLAGIEVPGQRFDCGSKTGMLSATLYVAEQTPEYSKILDEYCSGRKRLRHQAPTASNASGSPS